MRGELVDAQKVCLGPLHQSSLELWWFVSEIKDFGLTLSAMGSLWRVSGKRLPWSDSHFKSLSSSYVETRGGKSLLTPWLSSPSCLPPSLFKAAKSSHLVSVNLTVRIWEWRRSLFWLDSLGNMGLLSVFNQVKNKLGHPNEDETAHLN